VYGKALVAKRVVVNLLVEQALKREPITIYGTGEQVRNFVHVWDTAKAYQLAIERGARGIYNVAGEETISVRTLVDIVNSTSQQLLGHAVPVETKPERGAGNREVQSTSFTVDMERIKRDLGFQPEYTIERTVRELMSEEALETIPHM
ncbi:MAG: GDP-mannose 4,6-dehydratase, partial [Chloroflexota bacterium]|nr:GDP-mannose 4,6-dehydratase [Chloroflexota bacterium]